MAMRYSNNYIRDFNWLMASRKRFAFDGSPLVDVTVDPAGVDARQAFRKYDAEGKMVPTKHPNILRSLIRTKGAVNLQIKTWAEDRASGSLPLIMFSQRVANERYVDFERVSEIVDMETELNLLPWMVDAVEQQKKRYYP